MDIRAAWKVVASRRVGALRKLTTSMTEFTRACFAISAHRHGLITALREGPTDLTTLCDRMKWPPSSRTTLASWLEVGVSLGELSRGPRGYGLKGDLCRALSEPRNDDMLAMLEEVVGLHQELVLQTPVMAREGRRWQLADHSSDVVARSSRILEPFVEAAIARVVPSAGIRRVLEIGCGSGTYLRFMTARDPALDITGIDLSAVVVEQARANLAAWGVESRVSVAVCDVREHRPPALYDLATMHNNLYYFPVSERVALLRFVASLLSPGGTVLVTSASPGGSPATAVLNLWGEMTEGCGPLPDPREVVAQLEAAGFRDVTADDLMAPVDHFHAYVGRLPHNG